MKYKWLKENEMVLDTESNTTIPVGNGTAAAIDFAAWLAAGNTPDAADVVVAPHTVEPLAFLKRFTQAERIAIKASSDVQVQDFLLLITAAKDYIDLDDTNVTNGLAYLVALGLLTEARKAEILT